MLTGKPAHGLLQLALEVRLPGQSARKRKAVKRGQRDSVDCDDATALAASQAKGVIQGPLRGVRAVNTHDHTDRPVSPGIAASRRAYLTSRRIRTRVRDAHDPLPKPLRTRATPSNYI